MDNRTSTVTLHEGVENRYEYDQIDRLTRWERGADRFEVYSYDLAGNRVGLDSDTGSTTYAYDDADRLLTEIVVLAAGGTQSTAYQWDVNGNLLSKVTGAATTTYSWDVLDRLIQVDAPSGQFQYGYDPTSIRVRETQDGVTRRFLHDSEDVLAVYGSSGQEVYLAHGPGFDEPLARSEGAAVNYYHHDGLGSVTAPSDADGLLNGTRRYAAFGALESANGVAPHAAFTGREFDGTGLMYYRTRYYDPGAGRYLSADGFPGVAEAPQSLHRYAYVHNNPVNNVDPTGEVLPQLVLAVATIVAFVGGFFLGRGLARTINIPDFGSDGVTPIGEGGPGGVSARRQTVQLQRHDRFPGATFDGAASPVGGDPGCRLRRLLAVEPPSMGPLSPGSTTWPPAALW